MLIIEFKKFYEIQASIIYFIMEFHYRCFFTIDNDAKFTAEQPRDGLTYSWLGHLTGLSRQPELVTYCNTSILDLAG